MSKTLHMTLTGAALCLLASSLASAQDSTCESDTDCADGQRCESGLVLECTEPPCDSPPGRCVDATLGQPCTEDGDCGEGLTCARMLVTACPEGDEDCTPEPVEEEGYCADNATLAASSGLAPEAPIATASGAAGGSAPGTMESGAAPPSSGNSNSSSSSGCMVGNQTGGMAVLMPLSLALIALGLRRRYLY